MTDVKVFTVKEGDWLMFNNRPTVNGCVKVESIKDEGKQVYMKFDHGDLRINKKAIVQKCEDF